jgi:hypothetical protein
LRQPEAGATTGIELQPHGVAFVTFVAITHQRSGSGKTIEQIGTTCDPVVVTLRHSAACATSAAVATNKPVKTNITKRLMLPPDW